MKQLVMTMGVAAMVAASAFGGPITYTTADSQICLGADGCGMSTQLFGGVSVSYIPVASNTVNPSLLGSKSTFGSLGALMISCVGGGTDCAAVTLPSNLFLYIHVGQTVPTVGAGVIPGSVLAGAIAGSASNATVTWPIANAITIGNITYSVANNPLAIVPPSSKGGVTSIQGLITENTVPEPATYAMLASGLLAMGLARRRR